MHPSGTWHNAQDEPFEAVTPPLVRSSTFTFPDAATGAARFAGHDGGPVYGRLSNPTLARLEEALAQLERGDAAVATASGMGAIHVALMSLLKPGSHLVVDHCVYGCTHSLLRKLEMWGVRVTRIDTTDLYALRKAVKGGVDVVFLETPMNPTLRCADIAAAAAITHEAEGLLVMDNTFATPVAQRPLRLGADLVVHSLTKGINGHSDLLAGAVVGCVELIEGVRDWVKDAGPVLDAETAWLVLRGMQTLELRVRAQCTSSRELALALEAQGARVHHPLLGSHPDHALARRQMPLGVGVLAVDLGTQEAAHAFLDALRVFRRAVSLGGVESLATHPGSTTHATLGEEQRRRARISPGLVRLSVGVEPYDALLADALQALDAAGRTRRLELAQEA